MKKTQFVALALASIAGASYAQQTVSIGQASVTIYGVADLFYANMTGRNVANAGTASQSSNTTTFSGVGTGGWSASRLGFKGSMDVNADLSALFVLELGPLVLNDTTTNATTGNGLTKTRKSFVGLQSQSAGTFTIGRHQTPSFDWSFQYDPSGGAFSSLYAIASASGAGINAADRVNNSLQWTSPNWGGLTLKANLGFPKESNSDIDDGTPANHNQTVTNLSVGYNKGPVSIGAVARSASDTAGVCGTAASSITASKCSVAGSQAYKDGQSEWSLGGIYDFGVAKMFLSTQNLHKNSSAYDTRIDHVGATIPVFTDGTVVVSYAEGNSKALNGGNEVAVKASAYTILYNHKLNKSALAYVGFMNVANMDPANPLGALAPISGWTNTPTLTAPSTNTSQSVNGFGMGLTYTF